MAAHVLMSRANRKATNMTDNLPSPEHVSHWIALGHYNEVEKEELFMTFGATWRGRPVVVKMSADQYRHSSGMSNWRIYAIEAREADRTNQSGDYLGRGNNLTDTARRRLGDDLADVVRRWLDSPLYEESRRFAMDRCLMRMVGELGGNGRSRTDTVRAAIDKQADAAHLATVTRARNACDAFDAFRAIMEGEEAS
jgi:hypothetical protein